MGKKQQKKAPEKYQNTDFDSFLILPIQRIPRYKLLLKVSTFPFLLVIPKDLVKHTPKDHLDYHDLSKALDKISEIADWVNNRLYVFLFLLILAANISLTTR